MFKLLKHTPSAMAEVTGSRRAKSSKRYDNSDLRKAIESKSKTGSALENLDVRSAAFVVVIFSTDLFVAA